MLPSIELKRLRFIWVCASCKPIQQMDARFANENNGGKNEFGKRLRDSCYMPITDTLAKGLPLIPRIASICLIKKGCSNCLPFENLSFTRIGSD